MRTQVARFGLTHSLAAERRRHDCISGCRLQGRTDLFFGYDGSLCAHQQGRQTIPLLCICTFSTLGNRSSLLSRTCCQTIDASKQDPEGLAPSGVVHAFSAQSSIDLARSTIHSTSICMRKQDLETLLAFRYAQNILEGELNILSS